MQKLYISPTSTTPEVNLSPQENIFFIRGISAPEDVRAMYYPVIEWIKEFINELIAEGTTVFKSNSPLRFKTDLLYFNSSSAKFLYDIFLELKRLLPAEIPFIIEWFYDEEDLDLKEAGFDIAFLVGLEFIYISKKNIS